MLKVERLGGLAGFGGANLKSYGSLPLSDLSTADREVVDQLFERGNGLPAKGAADGFMYRLSRLGSQGVDTVLVPAESVPKAVTDVVVDKLD